MNVSSILFIFCFLRNLLAFITEKTERIFHFCHQTNHDDEKYLIG